MPRIHLVQCLCPDRHSVFAAAYEQGVQKGADVVRDIEALFARGRLKWECGLCGSHTLHFEDNKTGFTCMAEAVTAIGDLLKTQGYIQGVVEMVAAIGTLSKPLALVSVLRTSRLRATGPEVDEVRALMHAMNLTKEAAELLIWTYVEKQNELEAMRVADEQRGAGGDGDGAGV